MINAQLVAYHDFATLPNSVVHLFGILHLLTHQPTARVGEPASPAKGSHPGENSSAECRFAQSKEQGLGQAAEVGLLKHFLAREGAQFPVNEPPEIEWEEANSARQWD